MKIGDRVQILGQLAIDDADVGIVDRFQAGLVVVKFPDGWTRYYKPKELRVEPAAEVAQGAGA
jgi:hypothetical protein